MTRVLRSVRHFCVAAAALALAGCGYAVSQAPVVADPTPPEFVMKPTLLQQGTIVGRITGEAKGAKNRGALAQRKGAARGDVATNEYVNLADYKIVVHANGATLKDLVEDVVAEAAPHVGEWTVKWKLKRENEGILDEQFSLDTETTFGRFADYVSDFVLNYRGFRLKFEMFEAERVMVISD